VGSEYFINSQELENKVRELLPSQGGAGAGFDLSASTQIIPIIDLTESAEGSNVRQDLQTSFSLDNITAFSIIATTTDIVSNTGYWRVFGTSYNRMSSSATRTATIRVTDGITNKNLFANLTAAGAANLLQTLSYDFIVKLGAGDTLQGSCTADCGLNGAIRQIASIDGTLISP